MIEDCKVYKCEFQSIIFCHVFHETNGVAHHLAHLASHSFLDNLWLGETHSIIKDVLFEDLCKNDRGVGSSSPSDHATFLSKKKLMQV